MLVITAVFGNDFLQLGAQFRLKALKTKVQARTDGGVHCTDRRYKDAIQTKEREA